MTSSPTAHYDRLTLDNSNDNRRITTEGGIGTSALVIMMVYLLYEAVNAPAASAEQGSTMQSIGVGNVIVGSSPKNWERTRAIGSPQSKPGISTQPIAGVGISSFGSSGQQPSQASVGSSTAAGPGENSSNSAEFSSSPFNPNFRSSSSAASSAASSAIFSQQFLGEPSLSFFEGSNNNGIPRNRAAAPKIYSYKVIAVVNTDPEAIATSIEDAALADNSGLQVGIDQAVIVTKGTADQITAFTERLLSTSASSLEDSSSVVQNLEHFGINQSEINPSGNGAVLYVSVDELLTISQEAGTTLYTAVNQEQAGVRESFINMTDSSDFIKVESASDIQFVGTSENDDWSQDIRVSNVGLNGTQPPSTEEVSETNTNPNNQQQTDLSSSQESSVLTTADSEANETNAATQEEGLPPLDATSFAQSSNQAGEIDSDHAQPINEDIDPPPDEASLIADVSPQHKAELGNGNNQMDVNVAVGFNSSWNALSSDEDCGEVDCDEPTPNSQSVLHINAVAAQDYEITSGSGSDNFQLQATINPFFIDEWNEEMEKIALEEKGIFHEALSMNRSILNTGAGDDTALLKGDVKTSLVDLGKGNDSIRIEGSIKYSLINMGDGNDVALLVEPPKLTGMLLGGSGLDALSFDGTNTSVTINLNEQLASIDNGKRIHHSLKLDSIEIGIGGSGNDVLVAGEETVWLDGASGNDTYILSSNKVESENTNLGLNLSPEQLLNNTDQLVRWDQETNTAHKQHAFLVTNDSGIPSDYIDGTELLPIGDLNDVILHLGIAEGASGLFEGASFSPWGIITDGGDGRDSNILIARNGSTTTDYLQLAGLAMNSQSDSDTSPVAS